mmetsp:Transcript_60907/g.145157  ORF Transcript_60907/g.145157 Transcript_60907/m.145157 type:complete len:349 (+) Transcript_60907:137-1183(+)
MPDTSQELAENSRASQPSEDDSDGGTESTVEIPPRAEPPRLCFNDKEVVVARRRMQRQRKALLAEMQPVRMTLAEKSARKSGGSLATLSAAAHGGSLSGFAASAASTLKLPASESSDFSDPSLAEDRKGKLTKNFSSTCPDGFGGTSQRRAATYVAKVERFHRHMIRKEVWGQKFNFIYRQVQKEILDASSEQQDLDNTTNTALGGTFGSTTGGTTSVNVSNVLQLSRRRTQTPTPSMPPTPSAPNMSARRKMSTPRHAFTQSQNSNSEQLVPVESAPHSRQSVRPSTSLPSLIIDQHLSVVRQEYYGGDDLLMHEDILHSSNPRLFPLRPVPGRPFSAANLPALLAY